MILFFFRFGGLFAVKLIVEVFARKKCIISRIKTNFSYITSENRHKEKL